MALCNGLTRLLEVEVVIQRKKRVDYILIMGLTKFCISHIDGVGSPRRYNTYANSCKQSSCPPSSIRASCEN